MEKEIIFLCMIHIATGSLSKTAYRVDVCPEANNITAWKKASLRLNCSEFSENYSLDVVRGKKLYHCLPSNFMNETIEFCGPNAAIERGNCPIYNYEYGATTATSHSCKHFTKGCPDPKHSPYHSSSFYKYKACWDINKEFQCFYAEPGCPQREDKRYGTTSVNLGTSSFTEENTKRPNAAAIALGCIVVCLVGALIGLLFYFLKYKKRPKEKMDTLLGIENSPDIDEPSSNTIEALDPGEPIHSPLENFEMKTHLSNSFEDMDTLLRGENGPDIKDSSSNKVELLDQGICLSKNDNPSGMFEMETNPRRSFEDITQQHQRPDSSISDSSSAGDFSVAEQMRIIKDMRKAASTWRFNDFLEKLKVAMTPELVETIKCRLQDFMNGI